MTEQSLPMGDVLTLYKDVKWDLPGSYSTEPQGVLTDHLTEAEMVSSALRHLPGTHVPLLDIDVPAWLIPSSSSGHSHLYIRQPLTWPNYKLLLVTLAQVGIVEKGYMLASLRRGASFLRTPWNKKKEKEITFGPVPVVKFDDPTGAF